MKFEESKINEAFTDFIKKKQDLHYFLNGNELAKTLISGIKPNIGGFDGDFDNDCNWYLSGSCIIKSPIDEKCYSIDNKKFDCIIKVELDTNNKEVVTQILENRINIKK